VSYKRTSVVQSDLKLDRLEEAMVLPEEKEVIELDDDFLAISSIRCSNFDRMRKSHEADSHSTCSTANQRKRGLARFSLRRLLYSSPLVARRITRGASGNSKNSRNADARGSGPSRDVERGEAVRLSSVTIGGTPLHDEMQQVPSKASTFGASAGKEKKIT
ncbi:hypothetical protein L9F63_001085, partial [Diploptera punctata]